MGCSLHLGEVLRCNKALTEPTSIILLWPFLYYNLCAVNAQGTIIWCKDQLAVKDQIFDNHACAEFLLCPSRVFGFFTNAKIWQCCRHCQPCIPIYLQFPSLFVTYDASKYEIRHQWM